MLILTNFGNQKMDFLTLDKIFVLDNLNIVLDKKYFVRADGRGKNEQKTILKSIDVQLIRIQWLVS